jgi:quinohemoprotein ethanol dehydrogenase
MRKSLAAALGGIAALSLLAGFQSADRGVTLDRLVAAASEPHNWLTHGGTYLEQRFSPLDQISDANIAGLKLAWFYDFDTNRAQEATPIVVDGVMYVTSAWSKLFALDAATGKELWSYDPEVPGETGVKACCDVVNRGVAVLGDRLFFGTLDGRLIAVDRRTGKPAWSVVTVDQSKPYTITGAPRIVKGRVVIGNGGAELGVRGYVSAYDADTGKLAWRFYTVPGDPAAGPDGAASDEALAKVARPTWSGEYWKLGGGGTAWDAIVYDPELDQLYVGVGNGSPWNHRKRSAGKGDNLFLSSVVALDPDTGRYKWHYQGTPGETWDFTQTQPITLATLKIDGRDRKVLMQAPKNGFFYVVDRQTGKLISAKNFVPTTWATHVDPQTGRPVEAQGARFDKGPFVALPSALGAHNWHPQSFSPKTGLVYLPAQEIPFAYKEDPGYKDRPGAWNLGIDTVAGALPDDPAARRALRPLLKGHLAAWDPVAQREVWRVQHAGPWNGGTLATAGNLVFQGTAEGQFRAFRATDGKQLWSFPAQAGIGAGPVSYRVGDTQYVAVLVGYGGAYGLSGATLDNKVKPQPNGRVLVFSLNGKAQLPAWDPPELPPANPPKQVADAGTFARGQAIYEGNCGVCHGTSGASLGVLPDLRRSAALTDRDLWHGIVVEGQLKDRGMVSFAKYFSPAELETVRLYLGEQARKLAKEEGRAAD